MQNTTIYNRIAAKGKTIRAWDIPLNTIPEEIKAFFTKFGQVQSCKTQTIGMWQSANIEFTDQKDYDELATRWSIPFKADLIRIFPFLNTNQIKEERSHYCAKLTNLPPGTTGFDLKEIIKDTQARTCYIPRNRNYLRKRYAVISFKNEETLEIALETQYQLGNTVLEWHRMEDKLCAICNNANHLAKQCPI
jgi:RNA recognition motif-containing protein